MEDKLKQAIAAIMVDKNRREALAEMIVEFVQPNHIVTDVIGLLLNTRQLNPGDSLVKKIRKGIDVRTLVPGQIPLASEITVSDRINYVLDTGIVKVTYNEWELESGEIGTVEEIRREMLLKLKDYYMTKVFTALSTVWNASNTPNNYTSVGGTITSTALEDAIDRINQTTPGAKAVVGVRSAMTPITKFGAFWNDGGSNTVGVDSQLEEIVQRGMLGKYYGVPLIVLDQVWDNLEDYNTLIPTDKVLVIGENVGEFITYGSEKSSQFDDPRVVPPQWVLQTYQQFGMLIWNAGGIYVIGGLS